jgi:hypothetical protein
MAHDWLLVETNGDEPVVVALGRQLKNMVPLRTFLRRNPSSGAIASAVTDTARTGRGVRRSLPGSDRMICTEAVRMSDGRVHGVQCWNGPAGEEPPTRPVVGALTWNLTLGVATATPESLANSGMDPDSEPIQGRAFADDLPRDSLNPSEVEVLSLAIHCEPGDGICSAWDVTDHHGTPINVGFAARAILETQPDGSAHLISRALNWRGDPKSPPMAADRLAQRILDGLARPGTHRALVDPNTWTLLKWLDEPCPYYDWRPNGEPMVHPDDEGLFPAMTMEFTTGPTSRVLRLKGNGGGWVRMYVTVSRVELNDKNAAAMISLRLPSAAELTDPRLVALTHLRPSP